LEFFHSLYWHWIDESVLHRPHHRTCSSTGIGLYWICFKQFDDTLPAIEPRFGRRIQIRAELANAASSRN